MPPKPTRRASTSSLGSKGSKGSRGSKGSATANLTQDAAARRLQALERARQQRRRKQQEDARLPSMEVEMEEERGAVATATRSAELQRVVDFERAQGGGRDWGVEREGEERGQKRTNAGAAVYDPLPEGMTREGGTEELGDLSAFPARKQKQPELTPFEKAEEKKGKKRLKEHEVTMDTPRDESEFNLDPTLPGAGAVILAQAEDPRTAAPAPGTDDTILTAQTPLHQEEKDGDGIMVDNPGTGDASETSLIAQDGSEAMVEVQPQESQNLVDTPEPEWSTRLVTDFKQRADKQEAMVQLEAEIATFGKSRVPRRLTKKLNKLRNEVYALNNSIDHDTGLLLSGVEDLPQIFQMLDAQEDEEERSVAQPMEFDPETAEDFMADYQAERARIEKEQQGLYKSLRAHFTEEGKLKHANLGELRPLVEQVRKGKSSLAAINLEIQRMSNAYQEYLHKKEADRQSRIHSLEERFQRLEQTFMYQKFEPHRPYYRIISGEYKDVVDKKTKKKNKVFKANDKGWALLLRQYWALQGLMKSDHKDEGWIKKTKKALDEWYSSFYGNAKVEKNRVEIIKDLLRRRDAAKRHFNKHRPPVQEPETEARIAPEHQAYIDHTNQSIKAVNNDIRLDQERAQHTYDPGFVELTWTEIQATLIREVEDLLNQAVNDVSSNGPVLSTMLQKILDNVKKQTDALTPTLVQEFEEDMKLEKQTQIERVSKFGFNQGRDVFRSAQNGVLNDYIMNPLSFSAPNKQQMMLHSKLGLFVNQTRRLLTMVNEMIALRQNFLLPVYKSLNITQQVQGSKFDLATTHLFPPASLELRLKQLRLMPPEQRKIYENGPFMLAIKQFRPKFDINELTEDSYMGIVQGLNLEIKEFLQKECAMASVNWEDYVNGITRIERMKAYIMSQVNPQLPADQQTEPTPSKGTDVGALDVDAGASATPGGTMVNQSFNPTTNNQITRDKIDDAKRQTYRRLEEGYVLDLMKPVDGQSYIPMHADPSKFFFSQQDYKSLKNQFESLKPLVPKDVVKMPSTFINKTLAEYGDVLGITQRISQETDHPSIIQKEAIELQALVNAYDTYVSTTLPAYNMPNEGDPNNPAPPENANPAPTGPDTTLQSQFDSSGGGGGGQIDPTSNDSAISDQMTSGQQSMGYNMFYNQGSHWGNRTFATTEDQMMPDLWSSYYRN